MSLPSPTVPINRYDCLHLSPWIDLLLNAAAVLNNLKENRMWSLHQRQPISADSIPACEERDLMTWWSAVELQWSSLCCQDTTMWAFDESHFTTFITCSAKLVRSCCVMTCSSCRRWWCNLWPICNLHKIYLIPLNYVLLLRKKKHLVQTQNKVLTLSKGFPTAFLLKYRWDSE